VFTVNPAGKPLISEGGIVDIGDYLAATGSAPGEILLYLAINLLPRAYPREILDLLH
jgi:hypothetical protein